MVQRVLLPGIHFSRESIELPSEEAHHLIHVLRMKHGDPLEALNGSGFSCQGELHFLNQKTFFSPTAQAIQSDLEKTTLYPITLVMGLVKAEAMESVIEKCVELGVQSLQPLMSEHSVIQVKNKGADFFQKRWQKIADQSLKQCGRVFRMKIALPIELQSIPFRQDASLLWCNEKCTSENASMEKVFQKLNHSDRIHHYLFIGPEGGWSKHERSFFEEKKAHEVHLGPLTLRADTAAIYSTSILSFLIKNS